MLHSRASWQAPVVAAGSVVSSREGDRLTRPTPIAGAVAIFILRSKQGGAERTELLV